MICAPKWEFLSSRSICETPFFRTAKQALESGLSLPLSEHPHIRISYLPPTWTTSLSQFLYQHNLRVTLTDQLIVKNRRAHDECIMTLDLLTRYTPQQQHDVNLVRLRLQVTTRSDMYVNNLEACPFYSIGQCRPQEQIISNTA